MVMATLRQRLSEGSTKDELLAEGFVPSSVYRAIKQNASTRETPGRKTETLEPPSTSPASPRTRTRTRAAPPWVQNNDGLADLELDLRRKRIENQITTEDARAAKLASGQPAPERTQSGGQDSLWLVMADLLREKLGPARQAPQSPFSGVRELIEMIGAFRTLQPEPAAVPQQGLTPEMELQLLLARIDSEERLGVHRAEADAHVAETRADLFKMVGGWAGNLAAGLGKMTYAPEPQAQLTPENEEE